MVNPARTTVAGRVFNDLRNTARRQGRGTDELLVMYVLERWLFRASTSPYSGRFILKGGLLLAALDARRPTRDGDLLAQMDNDEALIVERICQIASIEHDDGITFLTDRAQAAAIRDEDQYAGVRVTMPAMVGTARVKLALDVNFGDPVTPGAVRMPYPCLLDSETFELWAYPIETVLAEKIVTAVARGETNTRERDWADVWRLTGAHDLRSDALAEALHRTAVHRQVSLQPLSQRLGALVDLRGGHYRTWRRRQGADADAYPEHLADLLADVVAFADPLLVGKVRGGRWDSKSGRWQSTPHHQQDRSAQSDHRR